MDLTSKTGFGPLYLETSRSRRLRLWTPLKDWFEAGDHEEGQYPYMNIEPWYEEPDPPWPRHPFTIPMSEIYYNAELYYRSLLWMIKSRIPAIYQKVDPSEREGSPEPKNAEQEKASKVWEKRHPGLKDELQNANIPGLGSAETDGMKFLVFRTVDVGRGYLKSFLESRDEPGPQTNTSETSAPFSYLFADTDGFTVEGNEASKKKDGLEHVQPSQLIGKSTDEVFQIFEDLVSLLKDMRSLYATRTFIILDEKAVSDGRHRSPLVVVVTHRSWCARRISRGALTKGVLKAFEMLFLDPDMLKTNEAGVITEDAYGLESS
ncbi:hypothetical protein BDV96DRAFT_654261 [Lophiotrema nucula]|uniref:Uncharacterized protein n=1 Tax=Lophiotrema nucula TaxID=690887 RepID=A0A6A5YIL5_9PLEO|nr:hypothetical protein BDV96DRAFT_654261 [Lophiotrema nucula]